MFLHLCVVNYFHWRFKFKFTLKFFKDTNNWNWFCCFRLTLIVSVKIIYSTLIRPNIVNVNEFLLYISLMDPEYHRHSGNALLISYYYHCTVETTKKSLWPPVNHSNDNIILRYSILFIKKKKKSFYAYPCTDILHGIVIRPLK